MLNNILAFVPLAVLIIIALKTRKMAEAMILSTLLGIFLIYKQHFLDGFLEVGYAVLGDSSFQFVIFVMVGFGGFIGLLQESGSLMGFRDFLGRFAKGRKKTLLLAWVLAVIMFIDEYLNSLSVTFSMRDICDKNGIPREHLAFQAHAMACCLCIQIPFTSWTAFTIGLISEEGFGFSDYLASIPYMFFPHLLVVLCLLMALDVVPKVGDLKKAYERVAAGGPVMPAEEKADQLVDMGQLDETKVSSAFHAVIPMVGLIVGVLAFDNDLLHGLLVALLAQFVLYVGGRIMTLSEYFNYFFEGAKGMTSLGIVICFGFMLSRVNRELGMFDILINGFSDSIPGLLLPALAFLLVALTTFSVGTCWVVMTIAMPIFLPLAISAGVSVPLVIAAVMSGVTLGYSLCFYADTVFMTTAGTGVSNITIIKSTLPYAIVLTVLSVIAFTVCGAVL